jgi:hypothetical protein
VDRHRVPLRDRRGTARLTAALALLPLLLVSVGCAALLAACGSSGDLAAAASPASPSPTPAPSPQITSGEPPAAAVDAVRTFWTLVGEGKLDEAKATVVAPGSPIEQWTGDDIAAAHFIRVVPDSVGRGPVQAATIEFCADVWIEPSQAGPNVWGDPREHQLFEHVVRMSDGTWRMWDSGTGP